MTPHERLLDMLATRSARTGSFTLASGRNSSLYIDARLTTMSPDGLATIGPLALDALRESGWNPDAVEDSRSGRIPFRTRSPTQAHSPACRSAPSP